MLLYLFVLLGIHSLWIPIVIHYYNYYQYEYYHNHYY